MITAVSSMSNNLAFGAKLPKPKKQWIPHAEYRQKQIDKLSEQIRIINSETDALYKYGCYDDAGRLDASSRSQIKKNEDQISRIKDMIADIKEKLS